MSYKANRNDGQNKGDNTSPSNIENKVQDVKNRAAQEAMSQGAKAAANAAAGPLGSKAVDLLSKTKFGKTALKKGSDMLQNKLKRGLPGIPGRAAVLSVPGQGPTENKDNKENNGNQTPDGKKIEQEAEQKETVEEENKQEKDKKRSETIAKKILIFKRRLAIISIVAPIALIFFMMIAVTIDANEEQTFKDMASYDELNGKDHIKGFYDENDKEANAFYDRVKSVKNEYLDDGKVVDDIKIIAVYTVISNHNTKTEYSFMTKNEIREIADLMFKDGVYDEDTFAKNLKDVYYPKLFPENPAYENKKLATNTLDIVKSYERNFGSGGKKCVGAGTCLYQVSGINIPGKSVVKEKLTLSSMKVRLMESGGEFGNGDFNMQIGEPLVDFEDYISGVGYANIAEDAPAEAIKAFMIVARNFAITRPTVVNNADGKRIKQEAKEMILQISTSKADQEYCSIRGCSYMGTSNGQNGMLKEGNVPGALKTKPALDKNSPLIASAKATMGEVLIDAENNLVAINYTEEDINKMIELANSGKTYKEILIEMYNNDKYNVSTVRKMSCNTGDKIECGFLSSGPFTNWKQFEGPWRDIRMGGTTHTINDVGCLATSVSILFAKSGLPSPISNFNPGSFVEYINGHGGFSITSDGYPIFNWGVMRTVNPSFVYQDQIVVRNYTSREAKLREIQRLLDSGAYIAAEVKGYTGQHWVAIDGIQGNDVIMMDPGSRSTNMWEEYDWRNTHNLAYYYIQ